MKTLVCDYLSTALNTEFSYEKLLIFWKKYFVIEYTHGKNVSRVQYSSIQLRHMTVEKYPSKAD